MLVVLLKYSKQDAKTPAVDSLHSGTRSLDLTGSPVVLYGSQPPPAPTMLHFSKGNAKLGKGTLVFSLPAGKTCPGALHCKSFAAVDINGKRSIVDGKETIFRCFAASSEVQYDQVFNNRSDNMQQVVNAIQDGSIVDLIDDSIKLHITKTIKLVRIHESGDFFSLEYLLAWLEVAERNPSIKFYAYSKSLEYFVDLELPSNFYITASKGGKFDHLIDHFERYSVVVADEQEAESLGLSVDHDDSHCFGDKPFALLVHGTQPKGSKLGAAIRQRRAKGLHAGYNQKNKVAA